MFLRSSSSRPEGHRLHTATKTLKQHVSDGVCQHSPMHDLFTHSLTNSILEQTRAQHAEKLVEQATSKLDNWATTRKTPTTCFYIVRTFSLEARTCNQKFSKTLRNLLYRGKTGSRFFTKQAHSKCVMLWRQTHRRVVSGTPAIRAHVRHKHLKLADKHVHDLLLDALGNALWGNTSSPPRSS